MKKITAVLFSVFLLVAVPFSLAQTGSPSPSSSTDLQEAQNLKDKIASKVAELRKKDQKAYAGTIVTISGTTVKIKTETGMQYDVKIDKDLTKIFTISAGQKKDSQLSNLAKNDYIIVTGPLTDKTLTANIVYIDEQFFQGSGKITEVNKTGFFLKVATLDKETYTLDVETFTKKYLLDAKTLSIDPTTLTKLKEGDTVEFVYKKTGREQEKNRYSAQKILIIPQEYFSK